MLDNIGHATRTLIFKAKPPIFRRQKAQGSSAFVYKIKKVFNHFWHRTDKRSTLFESEIKLHQKRWF